MIALIWPTLHYQDHTDRCYFEVLFLSTIDVFLFVIMYITF